MAGSLPVSINNVNLGSNANLYVSNDGLIVGYPTPFSTQYDGFTRLLTTEPYAVAKGQRYHIKLAIADAGDTVLDSMVYIQTQSLAVCPVGQVFCRGACTTCCAVSPPHTQPLAPPLEPNPAVLFFAFRLRVRRASGSTDALRARS
jgi:hypothetical protein